MDSISVSIDHISPTEMGAQEEVVILTENYEGETFNTGGRWTNEDRRTSEESSFITGKGNECTVMKLENETNGRVSLTGFIVSGGALYRLHLAFDAEEYERAEDILHNWANGLDE